MSLPELPAGSFEWGAITTAIIGTIFGAQKALKSWAGNTRDIEKTKGETDIVQLLRSELERMAKQNDKLATLVNKLQAQVIELTSKNAKMNLQIQMLDFELKGMSGIQTGETP